MKKHIIILTMILGITLNGITQNNNTQTSYWTTEYANKNRSQFILCEVGAKNSSTSPDRMYERLPDFYGLVGKLIRTWGDHNCLRPGISFTGISRDITSDITVGCESFGNPVNTDFNENSFKSQLLSYSVLEFGPRITLFNLAPKYGYDTRLNLINYPSLSISAEITPLSLNYLNIPFPYYTQKSTNTVELNSANTQYRFIDFCKNYSIKSDLDFGLFNLSMGMRYNLFNPQKISQSVSDQGNLESSTTQGKILHSSSKPLFYVGISTKISFSTNNHYRELEDVPQLEVEESSARIVGGNKNSPILYPQGEFEVVVPISKTNNVDAGIKSIEISQLVPNGQITIRKSNIQNESFTINKGKYFYHFKIKTFNVKQEILDLTLRIKFTNDDIHDQLFNIRLLIKPDVDLFNNFSITDVLTYIPSLDDLAQKIAGNVNLTDKEESLVVFPFGESKLGWLLAKLVVNKIANMNVLFAETKDDPILQAINPKYCINGFLSLDETKKNICLISGSINDRQSGNKTKDLTNNCKVKYNDDNEGYFLSTLINYKIKR